VGSDAMLKGIGDSHATNDSTPEPNGIIHNSAS
jgi:hypothetical protein